jgi:hypothetical protein
MYNAESKYSTSTQLIGASGKPVKLATTFSREFRWLPATMEEALMHRFSVPAVARIEGPLRVIPNSG